MRIAGVIISTDTRRYPAMRDFYAETLGLVARSDRTGFINFDLEGGRLTITTHSEVSGPNTMPGRILVNLAVKDLASDRDRLLRAGVRFVRSPEKESWGGLVSTIEDPDGNYIQLFQLPEE